eukprot:gene899-1739_t
MSVSPLSYASPSSGHLKMPANDLIEGNDDFGDMSSFKSLDFVSEEMKKMIRTANDAEYKRSEHDEYNPEKLFPDWILKDPKWIKAKTSNHENRISDIVQIPHWQRTQDQVTTLVQWVISVWPTANHMGEKRFQSLIQSFKYYPAEPDEPIMLESVNNFSYYIIVSGVCESSKNGVVIDAHLTKGQCFGDITSNNLFSTLSVKAKTKAELIYLHKSDYDGYVKDLKLAEKRENYHVLRDCKLFTNWSRAKIERMCNTCDRKVIEEDTYVFRQ